MPSNSKDNPSIGVLRPIRIVTICSVFTSDMNTPHVRNSASYPNVEVSTQAFPDQSSLFLAGHTTRQGR